MAKGLDGDAFARHVAALQRNPTPDMLQQATADALRELYMRPVDYHSASATLVRAAHKSIVGQIMVPFLRIGTEITRNAFIESTPLGLADSEVRARLFGGGAAADFQAAKITAGVALAGATVWLAAESLATGDGPSDPNERRVWLLDHQPNSVRIGDLWIPYQGLGHLGMLMRFAANMYETASRWQEEDGAKLAVSFLEGATHAVLDENFLRGLKDALDAVYHPQEYGASYVRNFAVNWLPWSVGLGQVARQIDPYQRETNSIFDAARARIPGVRQELPARRDVFGEPYLAGAERLPQYQADPVVRALEELQIGLAPVEKKIRGVRLDAGEYDDLARIAGRFTKMRLDAVVRMPGFDRFPASVRIEIIRKTVASSREAARAIIMAQHPEIIRQAMAAKYQDATQK
jgi:hypothetical protein